MADFKYSEDDLKAFPKSRLLEICDEYSVHCAKRWTKERILEALTPEIERQSIKVEDEIERIRLELDNTRSGLGKLTAEVFQGILKTVRSEDYNENQGLRELPGYGMRIVTYLNASFSHNRSGAHFEATPLEATTKLNYRTMIYTSLANLLDMHLGEPFYNKLANAIGIVKNYTAEAMKDLSREKKTRQAINLDDRQRNVLEIDFEPIFLWVQDVFNDLRVTNSRQWKVVSLALAIATGRRMAEIHTDCVFEAIEGETNLVRFKGQRKVKGATKEYYETEPWITIPCLVPSWRVIEALEWLEKNGKRINTGDRTDDANKANVRYCKDLNDAVKSYASHEWGISERVFENIDPNTKKKTTLTYHSLRQIYAQVSTDLFMPKGMKKIVYIADILGHSRASDRGIQDRLTPQSYDADYLVNNPMYSQD